jgi:signal transduction histidine kinase/ActR/RegA family two-component response regulator
MATANPPVAVDLIRLLYRQVPAVLAANFVNSSLVVVALWDEAGRPVLLGWAAAVVALTLFRGALWLCCRGRLAGGAEAARWGFRYTLGSLSSGLLWGSTAFLFVRTDEPTSLILVSFVIGGMGAGAVTSLSAHLPAFNLYLLGSMLPFELRLLSLGDRLSLVMSGMAAIYVVGLVIIGRNFNTALVRALILNEENQMLLATREKEVLLRTADLQAANADLEREVNERKRAEAGLVEARAEAEQANQAKSRFLAAASHDLRQPLQSMFLFASSLHRYIVDRKGVEALVRIERGLDILKGMLDSLLDLSRLDVNVTQPQIATFPLRPMLDDIVAAYRRIAASKGVDLRCGDLADILVLSDQTLLGRMVRNLVENAIRYTERGHIVLSARVAGDRVRVEVADTGIGIAPDQLGRIFEEFHQVGNPERDKAHGLGLGLAIIQRLSAILGHRVEVSSRLGLGSTFSIEVPVAAGPAAEPQPAAETVETAETGNDGRRVVVVDDDPMVLLALSTIFEQWGYEVTMAGSQDEAVGQLRSSAVPHLIVADYRLRSGRSGTEAIRGIRAACGAEIPSIVLTGETGSECLTAAEAVGALVLHKPVTPHDLAFALKRLTGADGAG